ncbi:PREDICTED: protein Shroom3 [Chinchilla lanigera]|uniref:protein Shroom3 n=1 Tax=Chinchilla lanigera TaxID=34839 RepID=UPI00069814C7|nr:PREDICTED: protein Shroom3 [Chinchilla lanigera]
MRTRERPQPRAPPGARHLYLEAVLEGGAPWGFTLKGGLERGEPLIISKIEEGGKADLVSSKLQAGDEVVHINEVALSSSRREAVSLVKGSYKTLRLVVRRLCTLPTAVDMVLSKGGCLALMFPRFGTQNPRRRRSSDVCAGPGHASPGDPGAEHLTPGPQLRKASWSGGVRLRLKHRRSEPTGRPHSWHTARLEEHQSEGSMMRISQGTVGAPWHQSYHSSSSTSDFSTYDHAYLRRSPDRCSSQGSMESLEPSGGYPPCRLLSPAKSTSSIDQLSHLHNKRDSAYSSFSTSSSILEYPPPGISGRERSGSMDTLTVRGGLLEGMKQADIRYVKTVYDPRRGVSAEYEVNSSAVLLQGRESQVSADGQGYDKWQNTPQGMGAPSSSWSQQCPSSLESATDNLPHRMGAPLPPARSDSYAAFRHRERPSSWSSLDQKRLGRPPAHSSGSLKAPLMEEQLHTVLERSPENSPPVRPKHNYTQKAQPGQPLLPTGIYPVPSLEPHFAQAPQVSLNSNGTLYPALAKESGYTAPQEACSRTAAFDENGNQSGASRPGFAFYQPLERDSLSAVERRPETAAKYVPYKVHFSSVPENEEDSSLNNHLTPPQGNSPHPSERNSAPSNKPCSNSHSLKPSQAPAWRVGEDQKPCRPLELWDRDFQEDHNANFWQKLEREGNFGRTRSAFSSLQNIPESFRRQSSLELGGGAPVGSSSGRPTCAVSTKAEGPERKADHRGHSDRPVSYPRTDERASVATCVCEEPPSAAHQRTSGPAPRRLSSGGAPAPQPPPSGQSRCPVLERVSRVERREQGGHKPPSAGGSAFSYHYVLSRAAPPGGATGGDLREAEAKPGVHFPEPRGDGDDGRAPEQEAAGRQPRGPRRRAQAEPAAPRRDARLPRSQSALQLPGTGTPEPPCSRAYRDSLKDAQCRVLGATSFRRRDLGPSAPAPRRPLSAHEGLRSAEACASPLGPRERRSAGPAEGFPAEGGPARPVPAVRRGPRRRLAPEQKARSYSEPERMHEVGIVAGEAGGRPVRGPSGPELRRLQQSALADYVWRKTRARPGPPAGGGPAEPPAGAPRDRSSSFAGGRFPRPDPQAPRTPGELLGAAAARGGPTSTPNADRTLGGPPFRGAAAAKSASAEDLLERSEVQAVPVHARSRSSPTTDKRRQGALLGEDTGFGFVRDPCYLAGPGPRSPSCSERGREEMPLLTHHPAPHWSGSGCKARCGSSVPNDCAGALDHQRQTSRAPGPRPLLPGAQGQFPEARAAPLTPLSSPLPSPVPSYCAQLTSDQQTGRDDQAGLQLLPPCTHAGTQRSNGHSPAPLPSPGSCESSSPEHEWGAGTWKRASLPQRPPPPPVKWARVTPEDGLPAEASPPEFADPKHCRKHLSLPSSCSTFDPDALGRVSLRISESGLQTAPVPQEYEEEVFVKDLHPKATSSPTFDAVPPPPPPLNQEAPVDSSDDFPLPPPQAECEAPLATEALEGPGHSISGQFSRMTIAREKPAPAAAHQIGSQPLPPRPQTSVRCPEPSESIAPPFRSAQPPLAGSPGQQLSLGPPTPSQPQSLSHEPPRGAQKLSSDPQKTSEDIRTEALAKEIVHQDKSLADILDPDSRMKTTMDLMEGLFPQNTDLQKEDGTKRKAMQRTVSHPAGDGKRSEDREAVGVLVSCPAYYSVSAAKAELLNKIKEMPEEASEEEEQADVNEKKAELIESLTHKLETLQEAKGSLLMDIKLNNALGEEVEALISELCKPNEFDKYKMFIGDLDKVVNLLLSLSGRLARVENVLSGLGEDASDEERSSLNEKRRVLAGQHEDARELKENLDRRERVVLDILANYLSEEQLQDYQHFVKMKSTLLIEQRKLDDKIKLGQEQVKCLLESLPADFTPKVGALTMPPDTPNQTTPLGRCTFSGVFSTITSPL